MRRLARCIAHATAVAALVYGAAAPADDMDMDDVDDAPTAEQMALDLVLVRPLSLAGTVLGTAIFVVALPFNVITLNLSDPARRLILEPAQYTFTRELGDLD